MADKQRRRRWSDDEKISIVAQTKVAGVSVAQVARRYALNANQIYQWVRNPRFNAEADGEHQGVFLPVEIAETLDLAPMHEGVAQPSCARHAGLSVTIKTPAGITLDIRDCTDIDQLCQLVRGLQ